MVQCKCPFDPSVANYSDLWSPWCSKRPLLKVTLFLSPYLLSQHYRVRLFKPAQDPAQSVAQRRHSINTCGTKSLWCYTTSYTKDWGLTERYIYLVLYLWSSCHSKHWVLLQCLSSPGNSRLEFWEVWVLLCRKRLAAFSEYRSGSTPFTYGSLSKITFHQHSHHRVRLGLWQGSHEEEINEDLMFWIIVWRLDRFCH